MSSTPTLLASSPLTQLTMPREDARGRQCQHDAQERGHQRLRVGRRFTSGQNAVDEILL